MNASPFDNSFSINGSMSWLIQGPPDSRSQSGMKCPSTQIGVPTDVANDMHKEKGNYLADGRAAERGFHETQNSKAVLYMTARAFL